MNTPTPSHPRALAHRLTTIGHSLHHRLLTQLHDSGIHPKTLLLLGAIDGRIDAPWVADRLARGGKRVTALADRGWIVRSGDGWALTDDGRALLDRVDAERSALLDGVPAEQLENLTTALDSLAALLGVDDDETADRSPRAGFRVVPGRRGFGPDPRRAFGPNEHHGFRVGERGSAGRRPAPSPGPVPRERDDHGVADDSGAHDHGFPERPHHRGAHGCGGPGHRRHRGVERAFERGFDAGFRRGREAGGAPSDPQA
ncbi:MULTISPECIES: MarR family winged helix-turn-helix transcriptional regulator [Microbacterium]|uniref:MarR family winged helix-turn-helix transcriptional regulator n=1 Tax=Microbacterium TaxID=33882 RepID=UPI00278BA7ED|nr:MULTISPECIES: hypothetical protein [Microbacterium]MDQ1082046.1 hypothetical protein [Microbacterium sp. SORGH_AS_0344]MDQ1169186.1 hypothetical protein [Microbacterium proteolyticum]